MTGLRRYRLTVGQDGASVDRFGPNDPLRLGVGRPAAQAAQLAKLIFPICPIAHTAAGLDAMERALNHDIGSARRAARDFLVLAEATAGCVWRQGLSWPALLDGRPATAAVKTARDTVDVIAAALFPGDWARLGGAATNPDGFALARAVDTLADAVADTGRAEPGVVALAAAESGLAAAQTHALGADITDPAMTPESAAREETPRTLYDRPASWGGLEDWFLAQAEHGRRLVDALRARLAGLRPAPAGASPAAGTGRGVGVVMTARGRLRHGVALKDGRVAAWRADAPTDWNCSRRGPMASVAAAMDIGSKGPAATRLLVAAFDPCAPCDGHGEPAPGPMRRGATNAKAMAAEEWTHA